MRPNISMKRSALLCCVATLLAVGCGEQLPQELEALSTQQSAEGSDTCSSGTCPTPRNGQGIYISEGSNYCIYLPVDRNFFCPEHFSNLPGGGVVLQGQTVTSAKGSPNPPLMKGLEVGARLNGVTVKVARFDTLDGQPTADVAVEGGSRFQLVGDELESLVFEVPENAPQFLLRILPAAREDGLWLYSVEYSLDQAATWQSYCDDNVGTAAFLPAKAIHSLSARMDVSTEETTMACRSGAISTCMAWGYRPWQASDPSEQSQLDFAYGSCLQAKRAAFFVHSRDYKSYTVSGTSLALQDKDQILNSVMPGVEAVWTPEGAVCLSPEYRRVPPDGSGPLPELPMPLELPECDEELHKAARRGLLSTLLGAQAPLATGSHH